MLRKTLLFFSLITISTISAQTRKDVLYTLKTNEQIIFSNEYKLAINNKDKNFLIFTRRITDSDTNYYAIRNKKELGPYEEILEPEGLGYFIARKSDGLYVNFPNQELGPYEKLGPRGNSTHHLHYNTETGDFAFSAIQDGDNIIVINGQIYGGYQEIYDKYTVLFRNFKFYDESKFFFRYKQDYKYFLNINGKDYNAGDTLNPYRQAFLYDEKTGDFLFEYKEHGKAYLNINGSVFTAGNKLISYSYANLKNFAFAYEEKGKIYVQTSSGKKYGDYEKVKYLKVTGQNNLTFAYHNEGKSYVRTTKNIYAAGKQVRMLNLDEKGNISFFCTNLHNDKRIDININKKKFGPYDDKYPIIKVLPSGFFIFTYQKNGYSYININGKESEPLKRVFFDRYTGIKDRNNYVYATLDRQNKWKFYQGKEVLQEENLVRDMRTDIYTPKFNIKIPYYAFFKEDGKTYIRYGKQNWGGYDKVAYSATVNKDTKGFVLKVEKEGKQFLLINGKEYEIDGYYNVDFDKKNFHVIFLKDKKYYMWTNSKIFELFDKKSEVIFDKAHKQFLAFVEGGAKFLINDKSHETPSFAHTYQEDINAFTWITIEGQKLMINYQDLK